jgi:hypothetical protein
MIPIGVTGAIAAGKDTFADTLVDNPCGVFEKYSLASPMKRIAMDVFGFTPEQVTDHALKETEDPFWGITPRRFLQIMGTDMFRDNFRQDVWLKLAQNHMIANPDKCIVIPDIRFENEAIFIKDMGGILVRIIRPGYSGTTESAGSHSSEQGIPDKYVDRQIQNDSDICSLRFKINSTWVNDLLGEINK